MNPFSPNRNSTLAIRNSKLAFTLVELLVVMTIIGVLAALIVTSAGYAMTYSRKVRVQGERNALVTAIEQYKLHKGFYPPDNTRNSALPPLFYELTGVVETNNPTFGHGFLGVDATFLPTTGSSTISTVFSVGGIVNSSSDPGSPAANFFAGTGKSSRTGTYYISGSSGATFTIFGVPTPPVPITPPGPPITGALTGGVAVNPWHYVSSNPTNNANEFDLWMDLSLGSKTNRISNWSTDPQPLN